MEQEGLKLDPAFNAELRRVIDERDAYCPRCKYNLSGIRGPRCPECGRNVREILRVADTTPWRLPHVRRKRILMYVLTRVGTAALVAGTVASVLYAVWAMGR